MVRTNEFGQPIGDDLGDWAPPAFPAHNEIEGTHVTLEPLKRPRHAIPLFHSFRANDASMWTYMSQGPFIDAAELGQLIDTMDKADDVFGYAVLVENGFQGFLTQMRAKPESGSIEIGWVAFAPAIQRTTVSTEAIYLLLNDAFTAGYRRVEWKCDALNERSRTTAKRLGFTYEGTFRQATTYKGRNRDTAWFSMTDEDWKASGPRLRTWLHPDNFSEDGTQRKRLSEIS